MNASKFLASLVMSAIITHPTLVASPHYAKLWRDLRKYVEE